MRHDLQIQPSLALPYHFQGYSSVLLQLNSSPFENSIFFVPKLPASSTDPGHKPIQMW